ncbi:ribose 5-phosphate isomerase A [Paenibacillus sp. FSL H8-0548]|uniref:ribose-5-phosphate isomerase RpiA n=1 Tax=Paenibacillus sp. FSL H8-0548 TaxID=1920422 RepID=UPI00096BE56F|nr:ribose-5-phosphate isomerase RpiA [Paenibacillus sp. FSL H8-0548]OMF38402.1 ribose 5-phosphate isomerase A [Paenibacillus sp. FSL H8-0548]
MESKRIAAERAVEFVKDGMIVGLGTGSTAYWAIQKIGKRVKEGLSVRAIATSTQSEELARELGISLLSPAEIDLIDVTIDGADEVDCNWNLTKGGGGALLREKIVASASKQLIIIVDESKIVDQLGKFPLPVEVIPFGYEMTIKKLQKLGAETVQRVSGDHAYRTDNGNFIVDCHFGTIEKPVELHQTLNLIAGVVDNGLFIDMATQVIVGYMDGSVRELTK